MKLTANAEAESKSSCSCIIRLFCNDCCNKLVLFFFPPKIPLGGASIDDDPDPVEVVSEMDEPDEKGGRDRSEGDGDDGAGGGRGDESSRKL